MSLKDVMLDPRVEADREALAAQGLPADALDGLFRRVAAHTVDRPVTLRDRLRELPTPVRILTVMGAGAFLVFACLAMLGIRPGMIAAGVAGTVVAAGGLVAMVGLATALSLRGMHQRAIGGWAWTVTSGALLLPIILALWPGLWPTDPAAAAQVTRSGLGCMALGLAVAAVAGLVVRSFQREDRLGGWRVTATAGASGLIAFTAVQLHCPATEGAHLLVGHGLVGIILAGAGLAAAYLTRRLSR